ncbi:MAG: Maf family protein [Phycisphaerales bacterium]|nr:Maf family protein [Phycisphaerales bacterium]MCB9836891.1 Maf family protein [Phycisphaera sp.]
MLSANDNQPRLVLASQSPRRRQLLTQAGYAFTVPTRLVDDGRLISGAVSPGDWVMALAYLKAAGASGGIGPGSVVLGADTVCVGEDELIGQPRDAAHAEAILRSFIGREHAVVTGVALLNPETGERELMLDEAVVRWGDVSDEEIASYIDTGQWRGKAGAYNLRERLEAGWAIEYRGDATSIMGLPMDLLNEKLPAWGIEPGVAA